jgi:hypothetical protein
MDSLIGTQTCITAKGLASSSSNIAGKVGVPIVHESWKWRREGHLGRISRIEYILKGMWGDVGFEES